MGVQRAGSIDANPLRIKDIQMTKEEKRAMAKKAHDEAIRQLVILETLCSEDPECAEDEKLLRKAIRALYALT